MPELNEAYDEPGNIEIAPKQVYGYRQLRMTIPPELSQYSAIWEGDVAEPRQSGRYLWNAPKVTLNASVNQENREEQIWPPFSFNPLTQEGLRDQVDSMAMDIILRIKTMRHLSIRERLANRLLSLHEDAKEEEPGEPGISLDSLRNFIAFLSHRKVKLPVISLTPEHNIFITWPFDEGQLISVHFLNHNKARLVIFKLNEMHREQKVRISMSLTTDMIIPKIELNGMLDWILE